MYTEKRLTKQPAIIFFIVAAIVLSACSGLIANANWPGITVMNDVVYVAYGPGVAAFDMAAGEELWNFPQEPNARVGYYAAPSVENNRIIIGDYGASGSFFSPGVKVTIYALEINDGAAPTVLWSNDTLARDRIVASPLQVADTVYIGTADNFVLAIDATDGNELWRFEAGHSIWAQPVYRDDTLYVVSLDKTLYALNAGTGELKWELSFGGSIVNKPAVGEGLLYLGTFDNKLHAIEVNTGAERWSVETGGWAWSGPTTADGVVYAADLLGNLYAIEADSGAAIWSKTDTGLGEIQASPVIVNNMVIFAAADNSGDVELRQGTLLALDATDGSELWREQTPARIFTTPVVANNTLVVVMSSGEGLIYTYDLSTGRPAGTPLLPAALATQE